MSSTTFQVTGMSCEHCERAIRTELAEVPGVRVEEVSAATGRLVVTGAVDVQQVLDAVEEAGYDAVLAEGAGR